MNAERPFSERPAARPQQPTQPAQRPAAPAQPVQPAQPQPGSGTGFTTPPKKGIGCLGWGLIAVAVIMLIGIVAGMVGDSPPSELDKRIKSCSTSLPSDVYKKCLDGTWP